MKKIIIYSIVFLMVGCASMHFSNYWPYSKVPPQKLKTLYPIEYEDCMTLLDSILSNEVIKHFKQTDPSVATIEICNGIGDFFITNWALNKYGETKGTTYNMPRHKLPDTPTDLPSRFIHDGVPHPHAMIRVMFNCYHKYLNSVPYSWRQEIEDIKSYWINPEIIYYYARVPDTIIKLENR